jgi:hypothetical protein
MSDFVRHQGTCADYVDGLFYKSWVSALLDRSGSRTSVSAPQAINVWPKRRDGRVFFYTNLVAVGSPKNPLMGCMSGLSTECRANISVREFCFASIVLIRGGRQTIALLRSHSLTLQLFDADAAPLSDRLAAFAALERFHHEEDVVGSRCRRDFGRFRSLVRLCWSALRLRPRRQSVSAHLSRTRRLSILVGLCRCPGWRADFALPLDNPARLGRACLARAPRAHLRLIRWRLFRLSVFGPFSDLMRRPA